MQHQDVGAFEDDDVEYEEVGEGYDEGVSEEEVDEELVEGVVEYDSDEEEEIEGDEADDEEDQPGGAGGAGGAGQEQMLYIPGLGYIPLANFPGLGGAARAGPAAAPPQPEGVRDWAKLQDMPQATQEGLLNALNALRDDGREELTLLVLGKGGVGKSSTINSLLNERVAAAAAFQQDNAKPTVYSRRAGGFTLHCIDTPSILEQDNVSEAKLEQIGKAVRDRPVDAVLYLERLDNYKVDRLDRESIQGVTRVLGPRIWDNVVLGFTRATESSCPANVDFTTHVEQRTEAVRAAIAQSGGSVKEMAVALIENSSRCPTNADGERVVPGEVPWVVDLVEKVAEVALNVEPYSYNPEAASKAANPNRRRKWLIPLVLAAQVALKLLLDKVMDEDACRGDSNGPFDAQTAKERREQLDREQEERQRRKEKRQRAAALAAQPDDARYLAAPLSSSDDEEDDDF